MKSFIQFLKEGVIDKPPKFYEGKHPHETFNNYNDNLDLFTKQIYGVDDEINPYFMSKHSYLDSKTGIETSIDMTHRHPQYKGNDRQLGAGQAKVSIGWKPDPTNPHSPNQYGDVGRNSTFFNTQTQTTAKINVGREHVNDFIEKQTPNGIKTINYSTPDPRRHALYQIIAKQYPHLTFRNMENTIPTKRIPKTGLGGKLGIAGVALGLATGANAADLLHGLNPLSVLDGGVANAETEYNNPELGSLADRTSRSNNLYFEKQKEQNRLAAEKEANANPKVLSKPIPKNYTY